MCTVRATSSSITANLDRQPPTDVADLPDTPVLDTPPSSMGLRVGRTKVAVYAISGLCSAIGGLLFAFYSLSGYSLSAVGTELDAIAAAVIGGTLLSGGVGLIVGSLLGVLVLGLTQTFISFEGTLSSWWTRIVIGILLLVFVILQRLFVRRA